MDAIQRLKRDHAILRSKLDALEAVLGLTGDTWFVLRELCFTLARQLADHIRREELLIASTRAAMDPIRLKQVTLEHHDEPEQLRVINRLFVSDNTHRLNKIRPALEGAIARLRRHMDEEEKDLFPLLPQSPEKGAEETIPAAIHPLDESMTINRIVQEFPRTKPALERLFVNIPVEGCHCLDEVAWRHGMETKDLLEALEGVICECQCGEKVMAGHE